MVQFKASSLLLVAVVVSYAQPSVLARKSNNLESRDDRLSTRAFQDMVVRAAVKEALLGRSTDLDSSDIFARDFEELEQRSPEPVTNFFKGVGQFVKRMFHAYWREMKDEISFLDFRKHHREHSFRSRRHRMEGEKLEARNDIEDYRSRRRRLLDGHLVRRSRLDDLRAGRHFSDGRLVTRTQQDDYRDRRRRFSTQHVTRSNANGDLVPRMSWYGKALLIYRDMKHPDAFRRSELDIERREIQRLLRLRNELQQRNLDGLD